MTCFVVVMEGYNISPEDETRRYNSLFLFQDTGGCVTTTCTNVTGMTWPEGKIRNSYSGDAMFGGKRQTNKESADSFLSMRVDIASCDKVAMTCQVIFLVFLTLLTLTLVCEKEKITQEKVELSIVVVRLPSQLTSF